MLIENVPSWIVNASVGLTLLAGVGVMALLAVLLWWWTIEKLIVVFKIKAALVEFIFDRHRNREDESRLRHRGRSRNASDSEDTHAN